MTIENESNKPAIDTKTLPTDTSFPRKDSQDGTPIAPSVKDGTSQKTPTSTEPDEVKKLNKDKIDMGRQIKQLTARAEGLEAQLSGTGEKIKALEEQLDDLAKDDPDRKGLLAKRRALEETETRLKKESAELEESKATHAERLAKAEATELETTVFEIAEAYEGGDAVKLKALAIKAKATTREAIDDLAVTLWTKKPATVPDETNPTFKADSGVTSGGGDPGPASGFGKIQKGFQKLHPNS